MKKTTLFSALLCVAAISFAQENPCPVINSSGVTDVNNNGNNTCMSRAFFNASGVQSKKSVRIQVFVGSLTTTALIDECKEIPRNSTATYFTADFTAACDAPIFLVLTRYTASNGDCQGGICGIDTLDESGGPLPIQMTGFYAKRKSNAVTLSWQTAAELNAKEFVIQKKMGSSFVDIASVAADNKSDGSSYSFYDINSAKGISQYRLKMVDRNGAFTYSEIRAVKGTTGSADFTIFPNPSKGDARVTVTDISGPTDIQLVDNTGRTIKVVSMNNNNTVDFTNLQKGMYLVRIINKASGEIVAKKLNVLN
jgi:hypothetical protein